MPDISNELTRKTWQQNIKPGIKYQISKKVALDAELETRLQVINNVFARNAPQLSQTFLSLLPTVHLAMGKVNLNYSRDIDLVQISDLTPYTITTSPQYSYTGNPDLKPTYKDVFSISYSNYDYQSGKNFAVDGNLSLYHNSVFTQRTVNAGLVETTRPINRDGQLTYRVYTKYGMDIIRKEDFHFKEATTLQLEYSHDFFILNNNDGFQNRYSAYLSQSVSLNWHDIIQFDPSYDFTYTRVGYAGINLPVRNNLTHRINSTFTFFILKKLNVSGTYNYAYTPLVTSGLQKHSNLLNVAIARQFLKKDRGEIKLSCYDILDQNIASYRFFETNAFQDTQSQVIKRYFMLTLQWKFNSSKLARGESRE